MPYPAKYPNLGSTVKVRIPKNCVSHIEYVLDHYEALAGKKGMGFVDKIQKNLEDSFDQIGWFIVNT